MIGIDDRDIARHIGDARHDTCDHLTDEEIAAALAGAPTLIECAKWLTGRYGRFVMKAHLARRIDASDALQLAQRRARAAADERLLAGYQGTGSR
jgi:hypothetical protein